MALVLTAWLLSVLGCGGNQPGENVSLKAVREECRTLENEELIERAASYRDLISARLDEIRKLDEQIASAQSATVTPADLEALKAERERVKESHAALVERYQIYMQTLVRRRVDVTDLRIQGEEKELPIDAPPY
jgi:hypothetical protein